MNQFEKVLFIPDIHCPYQDDRALEVLYSFISWHKPDTIFIMGDLLDGYAISRFTKNPNGALRFQSELDSAISVLESIRNISKKSKIYFIRGNHEARLQKFLWSNAKELSGLHALELENLLDFKRLNIQYVKEGMIRYKGIVVKHGSIVRKYAGYTAKAEFEKNGCSGVSAHCFDESTELLTKRGWVKGFDLLASDIVGTMNKKTKKFEWNKINKFFQYDNYKELYKIKGNAIDLLVTDKHGLIYEDEKGRQKEIEAGKMPETKGKLSFYNCALSNNNEQTKLIEPNLLRLLINIITDGTFSQNSIRWHLKKERKINHLIELLDYFNLKYSHNIRKNGNSVIRINCEDSKHLYELLDYKKVVPKWFANLKPDLVEVVLQEYAITDGCKNSSAVNSYQLTSGKEFEIDILQEMFVRNGYRATKTKHNTTWILTVNTRRTILLLKTNASIEEYNGKVWCVNVDNGTLLVRRNGKVSVTLNTHRQGVYRHTNSSDAYVWMECGHLGDPNQEYLEGEIANWQQGWGLGWFKKDSKRYYLELVPLINYKAFYGGKEFE